MPKYVLDENGNIKVKDGKPLVVGDDGKEFTVDAIGSLQIIADLHKESATHRNEAKKFKAIADKVGDLDIDTAREAITTVANLSDQHKLDVDNLKKTMNQTWEEKLKAEQDARTVAEEKLYEATVTSKFATSEVLKQTVLTPDIAASYFGKHYKKDGTAVDAAGNTIFSREKPGEAARFDEALQILIDSYPAKNSILRGSGAGGSGGHNAGGGGHALAQSEFYDKKSKKFSLTEQAKIAKTNPELHKRLKAEQNG